MCSNGQHYLAKDNNSANGRTIDRIDIRKFSSLNAMSCTYVRDTCSMQFYYHNTLVLLMLVSRHLLSDPHHDLDFNCRDA